MTLMYKLIVLLADGKWHSGESLGLALGVTRAAVWKQVKSLGAMGLHIESAKGAGYCLVGGVSLLNHNEIACALTAVSGRHDYAQDVILSCVEAIESTNKALLDSLNKQQSIHKMVVIAEGQTAGRGRRSRDWYSPYAQNLYFSVGWHFSGGIAQLQGLSLAVSVAIAQVLEVSLGVRLDLKWPNDLLYQGQKLGGILLELGGDLSGDCAVVVGVGLNVNMLQGDIGQPWTSLRAISDDKALIDRNMLVGSILGALCALMQGYPERGFASYKAAWQSYCAHIGRSVVIQSGSQSIQGVMRGVTSQGELMLERELDGELVCELIHGGEVSLRAK